MSSEEHEDPDAAAAAAAEAEYRAAWRDRIGEIVTVTLEQRLADAPGDRYVELRPPIKYERVRPRLVNPELPASIAKSRYLHSFVTETRPEGVATLHDVTMSWGSTLEFGDGRVLAEAATNGRYVPIRGEEPRRRYDQAVIGCRRAHRNYGHFLVEILPNLVLNREAFPDDAPILLHVGSHKFCRPMLRMTGIRPSQVEWIGRGPIHIGEAYWSTPTTTGLNTTSPNVTAFLRTLIDAVSDRGNAPERRRGRLGRKRRRGVRLYVGRADASTRHLLNEDELFAKLERRGFERVLAGTMTFDEQIRTFADAEVVVGVCGASMTNLVFMPPGGAVMLLTPETMAGYYFWDLASQVGLEYIIQWGPVGPPEHYKDGVRVVRDIPDVQIHSDFRIDVDLVERTLKDAGLW